MIRHFITESDEFTVDNAREAAVLLKHLGFRKGKRFNGVSGANYYIGNNCGVILYKNGIYFPKRYYATQDIINTDYTLRNTLPTLGLGLKQGYTISNSELEDLVAYTLLNNGRDVTLFFPASMDEIENNIDLAQKDGIAIRSIIDKYLSKVSKS